MFGRPIPSPNTEPALADVTDTEFDYFVDNNARANETFDRLFDFLYHYYFPRYT